jgi:SapC
MNARVPLRDLAHFRLLAPRVDKWIENISWIPVSSSELHLVCHYFPIVVRTAGEQPRLGVCLDDRLLARPTRDALGHWRVPYRPIAMRCFPFESRGISDDPLDDILIDPHSRYLSLVDGTPIIDETGRPARFIAGLHQLLGLLKRSEETFAALLDHYLIADLLLPLAPATVPADHTRFDIINFVRLSNLPTTALPAMARHSFHSIDVAMACLFSLQNLKQEHLPKGPAASQLFVQGARSHDPFLIDDLPIALDDSELIPLDFYKTTFGNRSIS